MKNKKTFLFNLEWFEILAEYPEDVRLEVYEAVMIYASTGSVPELSQLGRMAFSFIRREMDYNAGKYEQTVEKRRQAGSKGGRSKAERNAAKAQETTAEETVKETVKEDVKETVAVEPAVSANGLSREAELGFFEEIRNDERFWQEYSVSAKESVARLRECAESFFAEVLAKEGYHASAGDCKRHLINWVRYSLKNERKNDDKYDRRKGTDVKVHSFEEY